MPSRLFSLLSKGSALIFTTGLVGASASLPSVVKNVDPGCLPVADQVRSLVTDRYKSGEEKYKDNEHIWTSALELTDEQMSKPEGNFFCYLFGSMYGGALYYEDGETTETKKGLNVVRECLDGLWKKIKEGISEGWKSFGKDWEISNGSVSSSGGSSQDTVEAIAKEVTDRIEKIPNSKNEEIKKAMKEVRGIVEKLEGVGKTFRRKQSRNGSNDRQSDGKALNEALGDHFYYGAGGRENPNGVWITLSSAIEGRIEREVRKTVEILVGNQNDTDNNDKYRAIEKKLSGATKYCLAT